MAKTMCTILGAGFLLVGILGFLAPGLLGMHLSATHNIVHLVSGALALYVGLAASYSAARSFCFTFGIVYGLLGVVGFVMGSGPDRMLTIIPDHFMVGTADHIVHIILGALFLVGAMVRQPLPYSTDPAVRTDDRRNWDDRRDRR